MTRAIRTVLSVLLLSVVAPAAFAQSPEPRRTLPPIIQSPLPTLPPFSPLPTLSPLPQQTLSPVPLSGALPSGVHVCAQPLDSTAKVVTTLKAGGIVDVKGGADCATAGATAEAFLESTPLLLARTTAAADGSYDFPAATLPTSVMSGSHTVRVVTTRNGQRAEYTSAVTVDGGVRAASRDGLPATGRSTAQMLMWGFLLTLTGSQLLIWYDTRRQRARVPVLRTSGEADLGAGPRVAGPIGPQGPARSGPPDASSESNVVLRVREAIRDWMP